MNILALPPRQRAIAVVAGLLALILLLPAGSLLATHYGFSGLLILAAALTVSVGRSIKVARSSGQIVVNARAARAVASERSRRLLRRRDDLHRIANSDSLDARLGNRRRFEMDAKDLGRGDLLVLGDIAGLKVVNDTIGHVAGDVLLVAVSQALQTVARDGGYAYRFTGGDEYALILRDFPHARVKAVLTEIEAEVAAAVAAEPILDGARTWLRVGYAHGDDGLDLRARADAMLTACWQQEHAGV